MLREWPQAKVVLVWIAFGCSVLFYFSDDWSPAWNHPGAATQLSIVSGNNEGEIYTGSILLTRAGTDNCWERKFDNRTGAIWDKGLISCGTKEGNRGNSLASKRVGALQAYFHKR